MTDVAAGLEREAKVDVDDAFRVPDLTSHLEVTVATAPEVKLHATYYDTSDLRLARWGATLRYRATAEGVGQWTVKLPVADATDDSHLARHELDLDGGPGEPPLRAAELVRAFARGQPLAAVAELTTVRRRHTVLAPDGRRQLAEIDDDRVQYTSSSGRRGSFREIEVELARDAAPSVLADITAVLVEAGAQRGSGDAKVMRALGGTPSAELPPVRLGCAPQLGEVVARAVAGSVHRLLVHDPGVRLGLDPEAVHQARVATRRLRSDLGTLSDLVDRGWAARIRGELKELGTLLGAVRDADVLGDRLHGAIGELPEPDRATAEALVDALRSERDAARASLLEYLGSADYVMVLDDLIGAAHCPPVIHPGAPADKALGPLVSRRWRRVRRRVKGLGQDPPDAELHKVRIDVKRCRYAAELSAPVFGKRARQFARALAELQGVLGDLQDAVVSEGWLRRTSEPMPAAQALVAGQLVALERSHRAACRQAWPAAWRALREGRLREWLR